MVTERHAAAGGGLDEARFLLYLPQLVATWATDTNEALVDATLVFADIAGFTALTERLSAAGSIGSEQITDQVNAVFSEILSVARLEGGDLLSFGGDAVLLLFCGEEHRRRALTAAVEMQEAIGEEGDLGASMGVASGEVRLVLVGNRQRFALVLGHTVDAVLELESAAESGEVVASREVLDAVERGCTGPARASGFVVADAPEPSLVEVEPAASVWRQDVSRFVPGALHSELAVTGADGEHRQAVVGFVKVKGTTTTWRPDLAAALDDFVDRMVAVAEQHRITVLAADVDDDGVKFVITAGVPHAVPEPHERMMRTLRSVVDGAGDLDVRAGVADGSVFAGDLGAAFRRSFTVMGDPVNTAARLASVASRGQVVVSPAIVGRLEGRFVIEVGPPVSLKGKVDPMTPGVVGPAIAGTDGEQTQRSFVGRSQEMSQLDEALAAAQTAGSRVVAIRGAGGIGKTRLVQEFVARHADVTVIAVTAEEYQRSIPHRSISTLVRRALGMPLEASAEQAGVWLVDLVERRAPHLGPWAPLLGLVAEAAIETTPEVEDLDDQFVVPTAARAVIELASALEPGPVIVVVEDEEWIDPSSSELLDVCVELTIDQPWLWVFTGRSGGRHRKTVDIDLGPLADAEVLALVSEIAPDAPARHLERVVARSDGNPLFAIELALLGDTGSVPDTIERLIATRIDHLGTRERRLLRYASVLGTEFDLDLFAEALAPLAGGFDDAQTWAAVGEFLTVSALGRVRFEQGLVREVAYSGLSFRRRKEIHALVARTIERRARHRAKRFAAQLAVHYDEAGMAEKTWEFGRVAGERAAATWAHHEAVEHLRRALTAAGELDDVAADLVYDVAMAMAMSADVAAEFDAAQWALEVAAQSVSPLVPLELTVARARLDEKLGRLDDAADRIVARRPFGLDGHGLEALVMLAGVRYRQGHFEETEQLCLEVTEAGSEEEHPRTVAHALGLLSLAQTHLGRSGRRQHALRSLEMFEALAEWSQVGKTQNNIAIDSYYGGDWSDAAERYLAGRQASERAGDLVTVATFDNNLGEIESDRGHLDEAQRLFESARGVWVSAGYRVGEALAGSNLGRLALRSGDTKQALDLLAGALDGFGRIGANALVYETEIRLAAAEIAAGRLDAATERIDRLDDESDERDGTLDRLRGHVAALQGDIESAAAAFSRAIEQLQGDVNRFELGLAQRAAALLLDPMTDEGLETLQSLGAEGAFLLPLG